MVAFYYSTTIAFMAALAIASPLAAKRQSEGYSLTALGQTNAAINANGGAFYTGKFTSTSCPNGAADCSSFANVTTITVQNPTRAAMYDTAPGGQDIYVACNGALSFTEPHEEGVFPNGSYITGFYLVHSNNEELLLGFDGADNTGFATCGEDGQIFVLTDGNTCENPQPITISCTSAFSPGAFEYD